MILELFQSLSLQSTELPTSHPLSLVLVIPNLQKLTITFKEPMECSEEEIQREIEKREEGKWIITTTTQKEEEEGKNKEENDDQLQNSNTLKYLICGL